MVFSSTGIAAERFCVRNSGAIAVVEGTSYFKNSILTDSIRNSIQNLIRNSNRISEICFF